MLIKRLEVKGFKSLKDVVWEPGPLTILIGPNGSGKTNILKVLECLNFSAQRTLEEYTHANGGIYSILWDGSVNTTSILLTFPTAHNNSKNILYGISLKQSNDLYNYFISNEYLFIVGNKKESDCYINRENPNTAYIFQDNNHNKKEHLLPSPQESTLSQKFIRCDFIDEVRKILENISIHYCIETSSGNKIRQPLTARYQKTLHRDGQNLVNVLHTLYSENRDFENDINTAMRAAFGDDFDRLVFPPAADQLVQLRIRWKSLRREQSMADLSDGTIRFLFLMTVLCNPEPAPLIAIDEPETGLHPSMFPIIAEYAAEASKRTQVIFSTHSPQFLDAFSDFDVTTTVTSWQDGETRIKNLDGNALKEWLTHYSLGTLFLSGDLEALA
uniref:Putative ATPase n=1 Tax=Desulfovibrio sp. U5L TaxID=596152 RepID=I2PZ72_9BACT